VVSPSRLVLIDAEELRRARQAAGLTQQALGARAGMSANTISRAEHGLHRHMRHVTVAALARALGVPMAQLTLEDDRP
jgi:transcriptional regulator with XRE-family HTH domain